VHSVRSSQDRWSRRHGRYHSLLIRRCCRRVADGDSLLRWWRHWCRCCRWMHGARASRRWHPRDHPSVVGPAGVACRDRHPQYATRALPALHAPLVPSLALSRLLSRVMAPHPHQYCSTIVAHQPHLPTNPDQTKQAKRAPTSNQATTARSRDRSIEKE